MTDDLPEEKHPSNLYDPPEQSVRPRDPSQPRTVFPSAYRLDAAQERRLVDHAMRRLDELERELGRDMTMESDWHAGGSATDVREGARTFLGRRQLYEMTYDNEVDWRADTIGGIFAESNWLVPISRRVVTHQVARANAHFFGTEPWFSVDLQGAGDHDLKKQAERWCRSKFREAGIRGELEQAVERAFIRGEAIVKRAARVETDIYETEMTVLVDSSRPGPDGKPSPVLDSRGEYVTPERQVRIVREAVEPRGIARALGAAPAQRDAEYLADDMSVRLPESADRKWERRTVARRSVLYSGPYAETCYFKDILVPLAARSIDTADCVVHLYDIPVADLADQWRRESTAPGEAERNMDTAAAVSAIQEMRGNTGSSTAGDGGQSRMAAAASNRMERSEDFGAEAGDTRATAKVAEFWLRFDANGDGILENILLVVDRETETPIVYDYVSNVTPDGRRPFSVIRINPVPGRWYGFGSMQVYEKIQNICDLQVNRWNFSNSQAGRITFWNPEAIEGAETDTELEINWGETYRLRPDRTAKDAVDFVALPEVKAADLRSLMEFYLQMALNMSGVQHANDAQMAGLNSAKLATSILNIDKAGQEMFGQIISHLETGIEACANALAEIAVVNMADSEPYEWEEDDHLAFGAFSREQVGESRLRIRLLLSKYKAEQEKVTLGQVIDRAKEYFTLPPEAQEALASLYRQFLRAHDIEGADEIIDAGALPPMPEAGGFDPTTAPHGEPGEAADATRYATSAEAGIVGGLAATQARA